MAFNLRDWLEEAVAQVIPGDRRTASTVRKQRASQPARTVRSVNQPQGPQIFRQRPSMQQPIKQNPVFARPELAATTLNDAYKQQRQLATRASVSNKDPVVEVAKSIVKPLAYTANVGVVNPARQVVARATGNEQAYQNARQEQRQDLQPKRFFGNISQVGLDLAAPGVGRGAAQVAQRVLPRVAARIAAPAATGAAVGAGYNVANLAAENKSLAPRNVAVAAGQGAAAGGLLMGGIAAAPYAAQAVPAARRALMNADRQAFGTNPAVAQGGYVRRPDDMQSIADIQNAGNTRPQAALQKAYEDAHNIGNAAEANRIAQQMGDPALSGQPASTEARAIALQRMREVMAEQKPAALPVYNTKQTSGLDKAFRSTRSIIERQGRSGQELGGMLQASRDVQERYLGDLQKQMPVLSKLARPRLLGKNAWSNKEFENFVEATQGLAKPRNANVAQAVKEWQQVHPTIRERAVAAGLDVGDLGPEYYPHFIDYERVFKDKNTYNQAINHLVSTGQAPSTEEAIKLLGYARDVSRNRQFGNLEASRLVDLPFYDKTPNSLVSYLSGSAKRIAQTETFGAKDENALKLIKQIGLEGGDTEASKKAYDVAIGAKNYNDSNSLITPGFSTGVRKYITTTRLGLGALTNVSQSVNTGIVVGHLRTAKALLKQLDPKTRSFVGDTGVIADAVLNDMKTQQGYSSFSSKVFGKVVNKATAPFFGNVERANRSIAATAGRDYGLRLAQKGDIQALHKLGVRGDIKNNTLTEEQQIQVARKVVEKTQFKVDPQDLPGWADTPGGKLVAQFRTFSYNQSKFVSNEIIKPATKGNFLPLGRLLAALPLGYALYEARRRIDGRPEEENKLKTGLSSFQKVGGAGLALDIYQSLNPVGSQYLPSDRRASMAVGAFGGPAAGGAIQAIGAVSEAVQRKNTPEDESRLEGKVVAKKNDESYTDLTQAARFGISQVPIVGTPIKNRVLPYKKESQADTGKTEGKEGTPLAAALSIKKGNKQRTKDLKASLSEEDYALSRLSKKEQKSLVDKGVVSQKKIDGLNSYVKSKKKELGYEVSEGSELVKNIPKGLDKQYVDTLKRYDKMKPEAREKHINDTPNAEYEFEKAKYEKDFKNNKIDQAEEVRRTSKLAKLEAGQDTPKIVRDLYGLSKADASALVRKEANGKGIAKQLIAYGDKLVEAGIDTKNKFRDRYGNENFTSQSKKSSSSRKKGRKKRATFDYNLFGISNTLSSEKSLRALLKKAQL